MDWSEWVVPGIGVALEVFVIVFFSRSRAWCKFPAFSIYITFILLRNLLLIATFTHSQAYFLCYWLTAPVEILLTILATLESFWRVLRSFQLLRWFRFVLHAAIVWGRVGRCRSWSWFRAVRICDQPAGGFTSRKERRDLRRGVMDLVARH